MLEFKFDTNPRVRYIHRDGQWIATLNFNDLSRPEVVVKPEFSLSLDEMRKILDAWPIIRRGV